MKIDQYLKSSPVFQLYRAQHGLAARLRRLLLAENVSYFQAVILTSLQLDKNRIITPGALAKSFGLSRASISKMLSDLETQGWVYRNLTRQDARYFELTLSKEGAGKANRLIRLLDQLESSIEEKLGEDKLPGLLLSLWQLASED